MEKPPVAAWPGKQPCLFARTSRYPGRLLLPRHRRAPVSRYGAGHGHCRRGQAQQCPPTLGHGQPDGPTRGDRCQQGLQSPNIGAIGPRRRSRWATPPGAGPAISNDRQAQPPLPRHPDPGGPTPQRRSPIDPSNSHRTILKGPINETPPASPISTRAHHPHRVSAPGPAHADTPTPRN